MDYCEACDNPLKGGVCLECPNIPWSERYDCTVEYGVVIPRSKLRVLAGHSRGVRNIGLTNSWWFNHT